MKQVLAVRVGAKKAVGHIVCGGGLLYERKKRKQGEDNALVG